MSKLLPNPKKIKNKDGPPFKCTECPKTFAMKGALQTHLLVHFGVKCKYCKVSLTRGELRAHEKNHLDLNGKIQFKCEECPKQCENGPEFLAHYMEHYNARPYGCNVCDRRFKLKNVLGTHLTQAHSGGIEHKCKYCGVALNTVDKEKYLENHIDPDGNVQFKCEECSTVFETGPEFADHCTDHYEQHTYRCTICGLRCREKFNLAKHIRMTHKDVKTMIKCEDCEKQFENADEFANHVLEHRDKNRTFQCTICEQKFAREHNFNTHMESVHNEPKSTKNNLSEVDQTEKMTQQKKTAKNEYECKSCGMLFARKTSLQKHMLTHNDVEEDKDSSKKYQCKDCDYKCDVFHQFTVHKRKHTGEKPFGCSICNYRATSQAALNYHIPLHKKKQNLIDHYKCTHCDSNNVERPFNCEICDPNGETQGEKVHKCNFCDASFTSPRHLRQHMGRHTEEFKCSICEKVCTTKHVLENHLRNHNKSDKILQCKDCKETYTDHILFLNHRKTHISTEQENIECNICGKNCVTYNEFSNHRMYHRNHQRELLFACDECPRRFIGRRQLIAHKRAHLGGFQCKHCGIFVERQLSEHVKEHFDSNGKLQFKCQDCKQDFKNGPDFAAHYMEHYNKREFGCNLCDRRFERLAAQKQHIKNAHSDVASSSRTSQVKKQKVSASSSKNHELLNETHSSSSETDATSDLNGSEKSNEEYQDPASSSQIEMGLSQNYAEHSKAIFETNQPDLNLEEFSPLPLSVVMQTRLAKQKEEVLLVWIERPEPDVMAMIKMCPLRFIVFCKQISSRPFLHQRFRKAQFHVKHTDSTTVKWKMYSIGHSGITNKLENKHYNSYREVEQIVCQLVIPIALVNIVRYSEKGIYNQIKDQLTNSVIVCNNRSE